MEWRQGHLRTFPVSVVPVRERALLGRGFGADDWRVDGSSSGEDNCGDENDKTNENDCCDERERDDERDEGTQTKSALAFGAD